MVFLIISYIFNTSLSYIFIYVSFKALRKMWLNKAELLEDNKLKLFTKVIFFSLLLAIGVYGVVMFTIAFIEIIIFYFKNL